MSFSHFDLKQEVFSIPSGENARGKDCLSPSEREIGTRSVRDTKMFQIRKKKLTLANHTMFFLW